MAGEGREDMNVINYGSNYDTRDAAIRIRARVRLGPVCGRATQLYLRSEFSAASWHVGAALRCKQNSWAGRATGQYRVGLGKRQT